MLLPVLCIHACAISAHTCVHVSISASAPHLWLAATLQSTLQPAAEVLTFLKASATECQLELSCHSLRCMKRTIILTPGLQSAFRFNFSPLPCSQPSLLAAVAFG